MTSKRLMEIAYRWHTIVNDPNVSPQDKQKFNAWLNADSQHQVAYGQAEELEAVLNNLQCSDIDADLIQLSWKERICDVVQQLIPARQKAPLRYSFGILGALCLSLLFLMSYLPEQNPSVSVARLQLSSSTAEIIEQQLADGSNVTLGADSLLVVVMAEQERNFKLIRGQALFDVAHDPLRPFKVKANGLNAQATGTEFEVKRYGNRVTVAVSEGQVKVNLSGSAKPAPPGGGQTLQAGQAVTMVEDKLEENRSIEIESVGAWRDNRLVYSGASLIELIDDANRYSEHPIVLVDPAKLLISEKITATFNADNVKGMLEMLPEILPVTIDKKSTDIVLIKPVS